MRKILLVVVLFLMASVAFVHADRKLENKTVDEWWGYQWEQLDFIGPTVKEDIVSGVLAGISATRDYAFDLDSKIYEYYEAYSEFLEKKNVVRKIVETLDRYYEQNKGTYKYEDRVVTMILVIYGKYWWQ